MKRPSKPRRTFQAHKQVVHTAKQMALELYAGLMASDNTLYADWKRQCGDLTPQRAEELFVELLYPKLIEPARHMLARCLADPTLSHLHEDLYDALCKDYLFVQGRQRAARELIEVDKHGGTRVKKSPLRPH